MKARIIIVFDPFSFVEVEPFLQVIASISLSFFIIILLSSKFGIFVGESFPIVQLFKFII
jgi:hypothetical protein